MPGPSTGLTRVTISSPQRRVVAGRGADHPGSTRRCRAPPRAGARRVAGAGVRRRGGGHCRWGAPVRRRLERPGEPGHRARRGRCGPGGWALGGAPVRSRVDSAGAGRARRRGGAAARGRGVLPGVRRRGRRRGAMRVRDAVRVRRRPGAAGRFGAAEPGQSVAPARRSGGTAGHRASRGGRRRVRAAPVRRGRDGGRAGGVRGPARLLRRGLGCRRRGAHAAGDRYRRGATAGDPVRQAAHAGGDPALRHGILRGFGVAALVSSAILVRSTGIAGRLLVGVAAAAFLLRARLFVTVRHRVPLLAAGAGSYGLLAVALLGGHPSNANLALVAGLVLAALLVAAAGARYAGRAPSPYLGRAADLLDAICVVSVVPIACAVLNLFRLATGLIPT